MSFEQLENKGFAFLNIENQKGLTRQIIVLGVARGGTSLVAGALHHLGIFTGERSVSPVFEDVMLSNAFESYDINEAKRIVEMYSSKYKLWAWKRPSALNYINDVEDFFSNPFYIIVFKDIFSIANRNNISMMSDVKKGLEKALLDYSKIVEFVSKTKKPIMLVSAEKALQNKEFFVDALIEVNKSYSDLSLSKDKAVNFISPNSRDYLDNTRITKSIGKVGIVNNRFIRGWAYHIHDKNKPVNVDLYFDHILYKTVLCDEFRQHQLESGAHPTGKCGFTFDVDESIMNTDRVIRIIVKNDIKELNDGVFYMKDFL